MEYRFVPAARIDLLSAGDFYESRRVGLGMEFTEAIEWALARVLEAPRRWPELEPGIRRYRISRFPYALIYRITSSNAIEIIAVFHLHRRPGTWRRNLDSSS